MATYQFDSLRSNSSAANYKAWVTAFFAAFDVLGLPQTADSGQVVPSSITTVPSSAWRDWQIRRFDDALQASFPILMKIEVGYSATYTGVRITVGSSTNGSGAFNSANVGTAAPTNAFGAGVSPETSYFCGGVNGFVAVLFGGNLILYCERSKDNSGVDTGDYAVYGLVQSTSQKFIQPIHSSVGAPPIDQRFQYDSAINSKLWNGEVPTACIRPVMGHERNPLLGLLIGAINDWTNAEENNLVMYGNPHNYRAFNVGGAVTALSSTSGTLTTTLMRWE